MRTFSKGHLTFNNFFHSYEKVLEARFIDDVGECADCPVLDTIMQLHDSLLGVCIELYQKEFLTEQADVHFFEKELFQALEKEKLPMLFILLFLISDQQSYITPANVYLIASRCLEILESNGTGMRGNYIMRLLIENIILLPKSLVDQEKFEIFERLLSLPIVGSWQDYDVRDIYKYACKALAEGYTKKGWKILLSFYNTTPMTDIKENIVKGMLFSYVNKGLCNNNFEWI